MTATWWSLARKDFEDAVRSRLLWGLIGVFVAFLVMSMLTAEELFPDAVVVDEAKVLAGVGMLAQLFIPGIALVVGYMAIVGERRSGSLRVLLGYPFSRFDVVAGKLVGRTLVTGTAMAVGLAVASVLVVVVHGTPEPRSMVGFLGTSLLLGVTFTAFAVAGSAAASTRGRAMSLTIGGFMTMLFFWKPVLVGLYYAVNGTLPGLQADRWYFFLKRLNPIEAYRVLTGSALGERLEPIPNFPLEDVPATTTDAQLDLSNRIVGEVPFYLQDWFSVVVLLAWGVVPLVLGYWQFTRSDLG